MNSISISILGCGWLGLPLGAFLAKKGFVVKGSTTQAENFPTLKKNGIAPYQIILDPEVKANDISDFLNSEVLIINIPPQRRPDIESFHYRQFESLIEIMQNTPIKKVLFVSSTSVYPDVNKTITEDETLPSPAKGSGKALIKVEKLFLQQKSFQTTVLRFGGLIGYDRLPGRFLANKKEVPNAHAPINVIHQDDCINLIYELISQKIWGEVFHACADKHPLRKDYYTQAAQLIGLTPPEFKKEDSLDIKYKIINSEKIKKRLNYAFKYPDPIALLYQENV
jgi:nucleoside-diphosphate-sugar epimerase